MSIPLPRPVKDVLFRSYHKVRNSWPIWYYLLNREPRSVLAAQNPDMSDMVVASIIKDLRRDGIAVTSLKELFPSISLDELKRFLDVSLAHPRIREEITKHQQMIDERVDGGDERKGGGKYLKDFIVEPWGSTGNNTLSDFENPFIRMSLDERVLGIVARYMGMAPKFRGYSVRMTLPVPAGSREYFSQRWHRDPEDMRMLKMFIYVTDVANVSEGPFMYVKGSQLMGQFDHLFPQRPPAATYPDKAEVEKAVPAQAIKICTAPAGAIIFADTAGLHKGGYTTTKARLMYTGTYFSKASLARTRLDCSQDAGKKLSSLARYALDL